MNNNKYCRDYVMESKERYRRLSTLDSLKSRYHNMIINKEVDPFSNGQISSLLLCSQ